MLKRPRSDLEGDDLSLQVRSKCTSTFKKSRSETQDEYPRPCNHDDDFWKAFKKWFNKSRPSMDSKDCFEVGDIIAALQNQTICPLCKFLVETFHIRTPDYSYRIYERERPRSTIYLIFDPNPWFTRAGISANAGTTSCPYAWLQIGEEPDQPLICVSSLPEATPSEATRPVPPTLRLNKVYPKTRYEVEAFNGSILATEIDKWLGICDGTHIRCKLDKNELKRLPKDFRLFDVIDRRIMPYRDCLEAEKARFPLQEAFETLEYLTLSYVWGEQKWDHTKPYSLKERVPKQLPQTVEDAVRFTRDLKKRYLWFDLLCIDQENPADLEDQLKHMDSIYSSSWLTLVGVDGLNWDHGLRAISKSIVQTQQPILNMKKHQVKLMATYIHRQSEYDGSSAWDQRAFTLQERLLSRRCLLFADTYYAMICKEEFFHDLLRTDQVDPDNMSPRRPTHTFNLNKSTFRGDGSGLDLDEPSWNFSTYARLVSVYTRRKITKEEDIEKACIGALNRITQKTGTQFHSGLPKQDLLRALLWIPSHKSTHTRRDGFPSWSWLGWKGTTVYPEWMQVHGRAMGHSREEHAIHAADSKMAELNIDPARSRQPESRNDDATKISPIIEAKQAHLGVTTVRRFRVCCTDFESAESDGYPWAIELENGDILHNEVDENQDFKRSMNAFRLDQIQSDTVQRLDNQLDFVFVKSWSFDRDTNKLIEGDCASNRRVRCMVSTLVTFSDELGYHRLASVMIPRDAWQAAELRYEGKVTLV